MHDTRTRAAAWLATLTPDDLPDEITSGEAITDTARWLHSMRGLLSDEGPNNAAPTLDSVARVRAAMDLPPLTPAPEGAETDA